MRDGLKNEGPATPDPARGARPAGGGHAAARLVGAIWQPRGHPHGRRPPFRWPFRPPADRPPRNRPIYYVWTASPDHAVMSKNKTAGRRLSLIHI